MEKVICQTCDREIIEGESIYPLDDCSVCEDCWNKISGEFVE